MFVWLACLSAGLPACAGAAETGFDADRAFGYLRTQCRFGPRVPGSRGHKRCCDWITSTCRELDLETTHQTFSAYIPLMKKTVHLTNIIALHQPRNPRKVMLSAHWDTRPVADREVDPARRRLPILGANDGASGVAVLLELAQVFRRHPPRVGVVFVFFDGEDVGLPVSGGYCLGSEYLAGNTRPEWDFAKGINLDMVGDRDLSIPIEQNSWDKARGLAQELWNLAVPMYSETFRMDRPFRIQDDHDAFLARGKPYVDVIDFQYPHWHTLEDTEDKCSADSLGRVGNVIARFVQSQ